MPFFIIIIIINNNIFLIPDRKS